MKGYQYVQRLFRYLVANDDNGVKHQYGNR